MGYYEELDVAPSATPAEIRSAYLALARRFHPDGLASAEDAERETAARRMARINAAWTVLGDPGRRAEYDLATDVGDRPRATVRDPGDTWKPYDDADQVDPRLLDDTPTGAPTLRRELTFLPAGLTLAGVAALAIGFVVGLAPMFGLGLILLFCGLTSFLVVPLIALAKSSQADRL